MKQRKTLSIALVMSIALLSMLGSASPANAAAPQKYVADTGVMTLGPNQLLRLTITPPPGVEVVTIEYLVLGYIPSGCNDGGVCMHTIVSRTASDPMTVRRGEAVSIDISQTPNSSAVRGVVYLNSKNAEVKSQFVDIITGAGSSGGHVKVFDGSSFLLY